MSGRPANKVTSGTYREFSFKELKPNPQNPRRIFDAAPLGVLRESIKANGILVPLTVYLEKRNDQYYILDGERRWRCAEAIETDPSDPRRVVIPANVVDPPTPVANILWMFNIHNLREQWELMPTALSLEVLMNGLGETDDKRLSELTKVSMPQIKRCKTLLTYHKKYQAMMMDTDPSRRIKANFFIEIHPVLDLYEASPAAVRGGKTREELIQHFLVLYRSGKIASVIHFRRILEANDYLSEDGEIDAVKEERFHAALRTLATSEKHSIKKLFDPLTAEDKSVASAQKLCGDFLDEMRGLKVEHVVKRAPLKKALSAVQSYISDLLTKLEG
jgi:ParB/RepB/Spo0J family partition protein